MKKHFHFVSVLAMAWAVASARAANVNSVALENSSFDVAINPDTGVVAAVEPDANDVRFYPKLSSGGSTAGAVVVQTAKAPLGVVYKKFQTKAYFVVVCHDGNKVQLIDATTFKMVTEIAVSIPEPSSVMTSLNPNDPYIYFCGARGNESAMGAIDLRVLKEAGKVPTSGIAGSAMDGAVSADGSVMYTRGPWSPSGFAAFSLTRGDEGKPPTAAPLFYDHRSTAAYVPDPFAQSVATGSEVYSVDLKQKLGGLDVPVSAFMPHKPFLLGLKSGSGSSPAAGAGRRGATGVGAVNTSVLTIVSTNTLKTVASIELEIPAKNPSASGRGPAVQVSSGQADFKRFSYATHILVDARNDNVLVIDEKTARVIAIKDLALPAEPLLFATIDGNTQLAIGQKASLKLTPRDASVKVELIDGPKGMTLSGGTLAWTPGDDDIGAVNVALKLSGNGVERTQSLAVQVARGAVKVPFSADLLCLTADAGTALVATGQRSDLARIDPSTDQQPSRLALLDVKTSAVLADRTLMYSVSQIALDDQYVYAAARDSDAFYVLSRKDLSEVKRLFSTGRVTGLIARAGKLLVLTQSGTKLLNTADFSVLPASAAIAGDSGGQKFVDYGDAILVNGVFLDPQLGKIKAVQTVSALRTLNLDETRPGARAPAQSAALSRWGVYLDDSGGVRRPAGQLVGQLPSAGSTILATKPVIASLVTANHQVGGGMSSSTLTKGVLVFRDVITGGSQLTLALFDEPVAARNSGGIPRESRPVQFAGNSVAVLVNDRIYVVEVPQPDASKFPSPPTFASDQGVVVLSQGKSATLSFAVSGGSGPFEFALAREVPGLEIDKSTGSVTIKGDAFIDQAVDAVVAARNTLDLPSYQKTAGEAFKVLAGRDPAGVPAAISFSITARDKSLQSTTAQRVVLLELPLELVDRKMKEAASNQPVGGFGRGTIPAPSNDQAERIEKLEKRVDSLEAKIDLLVKLLNERK